MFEFALYSLCKTQIAAKHYVEVNDSTADKYLLKNRSHKSVIEEIKYIYEGVASSDGYIFFYFIGVYR